MLVGGGIWELGVGRGRCGNIFGCSSFVNTQQRDLTIWLWQFGPLKIPKLQQGAASVVCRNSYADYIYSDSASYLPPFPLPAGRVTVMMQFPAWLNWSNISAGDFLLPCDGKRSWQPLYFCPRSQAACLPSSKPHSPDFYFFLHSIRDMLRREMNRPQSPRLQLPHAGVSGNVRTTMTKHFSCSQLHY